MVILVCACVFLGLLIYANSGGEEEDGERESYSVYVTAKVLEVTEENLAMQEEYENSYVGDQTLRVRVTSGDYEGEEMQAKNFLSALYGTKLCEGDSVVLSISITRGEIGNVMVYEYDKTTPLIIMVVMFVLATVLIGGRKGALSLIGLVLTVVALIWILMPLLIKGFPTIITTFGLCILLAVICFTLLGGVTRKTVCAMIGTACGLGFAVVFGLIGQAVCRIDGMRMGEYIDALLQLKLGGAEIGLKGLLIGGTIVSALGAVMDVAMSISSAANELVAVNPGLTRKQIWKSGMNIGRDMIGTMTNTLILAFVGSSFVLILYIYTMNIPFHELFSSNLVVTEFVHALASSMGVILSVPLTVFVSAWLLKGTGK